ncbi:hydroxyethylthiazole kinase [Synergistales bacterium]|nr:hydroxyethylthiazole kinase [Synergistales bacterium]
MIKAAEERAAKYAAILNDLRAKRPLVHHITNYVTVNDCANITLAIGASPIMADAAEEAGDIAAISSSLVLNMGTLNSRTLESMIIAGRSANANGVPVIFDPVGAGASKLRNDAAARVLSEVRIGVLRGNISEIRFIGGIGAGAKGVDADAEDANADAAEIALSLARRLKCVVAITGAVDAVSDGARTAGIENGCPAMSGITGTGCMCSSLVGSFCGTRGDSFDETVAALLSMGIAGEIAYEKTGNALGSFRAAIIDAISRLDAQTLVRRAKLYEA